MCKLLKVGFIVLAFIIAVVPALGVYSEINTSRLSFSEGVSDLQVMVTRYEPYPAQPGKYIDLWLKVENRGTRDAPNVEFELRPKYPFSLYGDDTAIRSIGKLIPFQAALMKYRIKVDDTAVLGTNQLVYAFHENSYLPWKEAIVDVYIQPRDLNLAIDKIDVSPNKIGPGQKGKITLTIKNYGDAYAENIRVGLGLSQAIVPLASVGEKRIETIAPGASTDISFDVVALSDAESKIHMIPVGILYFDSTGKSYNLTSIFALQVAETPKIYFVVDSTTLTGEKTSGKITIKSVNPGASGIKFLDISLQKSDAYEILSPDRAYVGKIDSDDYQSTDFTVYLKKTKNNEFSLPIVATYSDATNEEFQISENLTVSLDANKYAQKQSSGFPTWIILVILIAAGYFIYRWRKKKKVKDAKQSSK